MGLQLAGLSNWFGMKYPSRRLVIQPVRRRIAPSVPSQPGLRTSSAPKASRIFRRSRLTHSGITSLTLYPGPRRPWPGRCRCCPTWLRGWYRLISMHRHQPCRRCGHKQLWRHERDEWWALLLPRGGKVGGCWAASMCSPLAVSLCSAVLLKLGQGKAPVVSTKRSSNPAGSMPARGHTFEDSTFTLVMETTPSARRRTASCRGRRGG